jgi:hypothetical protein
MRLPDPPSGHDKVGQKTVFVGLRAFPWIPGLIAFARNDGFLMWPTFYFELDFVALRLSGLAAWCEASMNCHFKEAGSCSH